MTTAFSLQEPTVSTGKELDQAGASAKERAEIESAIIVAKKFPRNEAEAFQELMKACSRPSFAEDATYSFPRGDKEVSGPSVNLAREAGRIFGNVRFGLYIVREDDESVLIRGWAWDVQKNTKVEHEDSFRKLIQRKGKGWIVPDERDLRELVNRRGAILVRNSLLQIMPRDLIEDALYQCRSTLEQRAEEDPDSTRKRLLVDFASINVSVEQIEQKLGHSFAQATPKELAELRGICNSILNGNSTWTEYVKGPEPKPSTPEQAENKAKLEEGQRALKEQQAHAAPVETAPSGDSEEAKFNRFAKRMREAETVPVMADIMNQALNGPDSLLSAEHRQAITKLKDECLAKMRKKK